MKTRKMVRVRFVPQVWINDYAVTADPQGPETFLIPAEDAKNGRRWLKDHAYESDSLRTHPNAPAWIKNWPGPFEIELEVRR